MVEREIRIFLFFSSDGGSSFHVSGFDDTLAFYIIVAVGQRFSRVFRFSHSCRTAGVGNTETKHISLVQPHLTSYALTAHLITVAMTTEPGNEASPLLVSPTNALLRTYEATLNSSTVAAEKRRGIRRSSSRETMDTAAVDEVERPKTSDAESVLHLVKGYLGAGCLSLPYAVSQLGIPGGILSIFVLSYWTSSNCYTVVNIKRHMGRTSLLTTNNKHDEQENEMSETSSNITYPDVGEWAYGTRFQAYVSTCIILLQGAVCTVYVSFMGENLLAVAQYFEIPWITHTTVMVIALPFIMSLNFVPSLKMLAPIMAIATALLIASLAGLGIIVAQEWPSRPDEMPDIQPSKIPAALCMILYSYEGINIILPVHAAMKSPAHFDVVFWFAMAIVALCLAGVAVICVLAFGNVTNGSVTAFLLEKYQNDSDSRFTTWIMFVNTVVSLSVLLTYPLSMYPAIELVGPLLQRNAFLSRMTGNQNAVDDDDDDFRDPLEAFEPLPPLPEHGAFSEEDVNEHAYGVDRVDSMALNGQNGKCEGQEDGDAVSIVVAQPSIYTMPGDSPQLRASLVLVTFLIATVVPNVQSLISIVGMF